MIMLGNAPAGKAANLSPGWGRTCGLQTFRARLKILIVSPLLTGTDMHAFGQVSGKLIVGLLVSVLLSVGTPASAQGLLFPDGIPRQLNFRSDADGGHAFRLDATKTGVIQEKCLMSWDDSHQVHSVRTIVTWNYQATKTTMKKLAHCIKLRVVGPVDVADIAKSYVDDCIDHALNDNKARHALQLVVALGVDILSEGSTGGGATATAVSDYLIAVQERAMSCLTNTGRISQFLNAQLKATFDATVKEESEWVYWEL